MFSPWIGIVFFGTNANNNRPIIDLMIYKSYRAIFSCVNQGPFEVI